MEQMPVGRGPGAIAQGERGGGSPWPRAAAGTRSGVVVDAARDGSAILPPTLRGVERRLVRRAEVLWDSLQEEGQLPTGGQVGPFLLPPFGRQVVLYAGDWQGTTPPRVVFVGSDILALGLLDADGSGPGLLPRQLATAAAEAAMAGAPVWFDSDASRRGLKASALSPTLLMRGVALPFEPDAGGAQLVLVVLSWRQLLSAEETQALQQELAAAVEWMRDHLPPAG